MAMDCLIPQFLADVSQAPTHSLDSGTWIGLVIATCASAYIYYRSKRKTKRDPLETHSSSVSMAQQRAVERQMSNLLIELSDMARTVSATIDTRAAKLEALIDEADRRIEILRAMNENRPEATPMLAAAPMKQLEHAEPKLVVTLATQRATPVDDRHVRVYELADCGRSVHEIATELARPSGEIELILALRSREVTAKAS
jgi:hypothetical protein